MEEWMQTQQHYQGRNRSFSMSHADNISSFYHQLQQQQQQKTQQAFPQPHPHQPAAMMTDSFLQEGSPLSMSSSCGSDDAAYSSDYAPQSQSMGMMQQQNAYEQSSQALPGSSHLQQRRASLSSTPVAGGVGTSLGILGGFVGEGLRAEYASRRPGGRRKSICLSPPQQDVQMGVAEAQPSYSSVPDSEAAESAMDATAAMRRNSLPSVSARRNSLSCPLVHNYTPLTAVPTLGRALAEGNLGQRKSIQSFLSMLAQSSNERSDKRRKRKSSRKDRGKRYKRSDYDESSDDEDDDSSEEGVAHPSNGGQNPFASPADHHDSSAAPFSGFDYSSGALAAEGSVGSDSSSDTIPSSVGDQSTPGPYEPITPSSSSEQLYPPYAPGPDAASSFGGSMGGRPRSRSSPPSYIDAQTAPLTHQQQLQRQYHIAQTNKRLQELRQQHLERLQRQMELERQQAQQQRHSYEYVPQRYAQPLQAQHQGFPPQAHVLDLEVPHHARMAGPQMGGHQPTASASLPSVLPSHDLGPYHHYAPPDQLGDLMHQQPPLSQEVLMDQQVRGAVADFDFYNEFSDFNMCEPANMESLCRTVPEDHHKAPVTTIAVGSDQLSTDDGPVSEILDEFSVVPASAFVNGSWTGAGAAEAQDGYSAIERKDHHGNDDVFNELFNLDDPGMGSSH